MSTRRLLTSLGLALAAISCSDAVVPSSSPEAVDLPLASLGEAASEPMAGSDVHILRLASGAEPETYALSFWAVKGKAASVRVKYKDSGLANLNLLQFDVPKEGLYRRPDGSRLSSGDSVEIRLSIDPSTMKVEFQPSGLRFSDRNPATLKFWYNRVDPDLNADGTVNAADDALYPVLAVWYAPDGSSTWTRLVSQVDLTQRWVTTNIYHFSGYVVAW